MGVAILNVWVVLCHPRHKVGLAVGIIPTLEVAVLGGPKPSGPFDINQLVDDVGILRFG